MGQSEREVAAQAVGQLEKRDWSRNEANEHDMRRASNKRERRTKTDDT